MNRRRTTLLCALLASAASAGTSWSAQAVLESKGPVQGDRVTDVGPTWTESMDAVYARAALEGPTSHIASRDRSGRHGQWEVPNQRSTFHPHSGWHTLINKWGDTHMALGFNDVVDLDGVWIAGQAASGVWTTGLRVLGFREGAEVARTDWFTQIGDESSWFEIDLDGVDRVVFESQAVYNGAGFYALDDLTFTVSGQQRVLDFEDVRHGTKLTGSGYAGLTWEEGFGQYPTTVVGVQAPKTLRAAPGASQTGGGSIFGGGGTAPTMIQDFVATKMFDAGANAYPADTCGAAGPTHFMVLTNSNISAYDKVTGARDVNTTMSSFWGAGVGDPRCVYDPMSDRFVILATNFNNRIYFAISNTSDPTGSWTKSSFNPGTGSDSGDWSDYPTLGVGENGVYTCAYMVGGSPTMSAFCISKSSLISGSPVVTAFRSLQWDGAIQPCVHWDSSPEDYLIARRNSGGAFRLRRITWSGSTATLASTTLISAVTGGNPPNVPALGSSTNVNTVGPRHMSAMYRNGSIWTAGTINIGNRAACRWFEIDAASNSVVQYGTVQDEIRGYYFPSVAVNANGDALISFSGSHPDEWIGTWYAGRVSTDPSGQMSAPQQSKAGEGAWNRVDGAGRNRWGDYSLSTPDPTDGTVWTVQSYARTSNRWGTHVAQFEMTEVCPAPTNYCATSPNSLGSGMVMVSSGGGSFASNDLSFLSIGGPPGQFGIYFMGLNQTGTFFGDGILCVGGGIIRYPIQQIDAFTTASLVVDYTAPPSLGAMIPGSVWNFQFWYRDPLFGGAGFNTTDAVHVTVCD